jgi:hypothetical protein
MPDLTTFHYLRWATYPKTAQTFLQGANTPDGPWHKLTKRETRTILAMAQAEARKQPAPVAPTPHST